MSWQAVTWVASEVRGITPTLRMVLMTMANHAQADGTRVFAGRARLADEVELSVRQLQRVLVALEKRGLIRRGDQSYGLMAVKERKGLQRPTYAPVVWDLCMSGSVVQGLDADQPPIGVTDDDDPGLAGEDEVPQAPSATALSPQVGSGDILSPLPDLRKDSRGVKVAEIRSLASVSPQVGSGDILSPLLDLHRRTCGQDVDKSVDNAAARDRVGTESGFSEDISGRLEGTSGVPQVVRALFTGGYHPSR